MPKVMFGLVFDGAIYLKVDETSIPDFEREGSRPFVYTRAKSPGRVGRTSLSYWRLPERLYDDPDELAVWAARALVIAERKKFAAGGRGKRKQSRSTKFISVFNSGVRCDGMAGTSRLAGPVTSAMPLIEWSAASAHAVAERILPRSAAAEDRGR